MGGLLTKKRLTKAVVAVLAAALLVAGTAWVVRSVGHGDAADSGQTDPMAPEPIEPVAAEDIQDVSITMDVPTYDLGIEGHSGSMEIIVDNGSGTPLRDVALDVIMDDPGGDLPPMMVAGDTSHCEYAPEYDDPDTDHQKENYVDEECVQQQRKGKQGCTLSVRGEGDYADARHSRCVQTLKEGENRFGFDLRIPADNATEVRDYPQVTATARLSVADEEFAVTREQVKTKYPKEWDRVKFNDFPKVIDADRTESDPYHWSITVTNDTDKALRNATALFDTGHKVGIASGRSGCHRDAESPKDYRLLCDGIDLPAGGSLTISLTAYFIGDVEGLKKSDCPPDRDGCLDDRLSFWISAPDERVLASGEASTTIRLEE